MTFTTAPKQGSGRRAGCSLVALALIGSAFLAVGGQAPAQPKPPQLGPVDYLASPGCPVEYRTEKTSEYSLEEQTRALHWKFKVHSQIIELKPPVDWERNPIDSKAFAARLADLAFLDQLLYIYVASPNFKTPNKLRALRMAREIALTWIKAANAGDVSSETWTDRVAARRAAFIAFIARAAACEGVIGREDAKLMLASIRKHGRYLRNDANYKATNHGLSIDLALASLGRYLPQDRFLARGAVRGEQRYRRTFYGSFQAAEGVWLEHSMGYYDYAINLIDDYLRIVNPNDAELQAARAQLVTSLAWLTAPDEKMAQFGDTSLDKPQAEVRTLASSQSGLWAAPASGYAVVKDQAAGGWLAIASSYHSGVHKHSDELSFELYERGVRVVQDTGQYHKDRDDYFNFQRSPSAHSTLVVDGQGNDSEDYTPYGGGIFAWGAGDGWYAVWAQNPVLVEAQGVLHARLFLYKPGYALFIGDAVVSAEPHTYKRYVQFGTKLTAAQEDDGVKLSGHGLKAQVTSSSAVGPGDLELFTGQSSPLAGWSYPNFREEKARTTAAWRTAGTSLDHLTTFSLNGFNLRGALATPLADDTTVVVQDTSGKTLETVRVLRTETAITVDATP